MPKISVIVPCYNVEKYIRTCLDSLLNQTLRDIEIICVDDKSPDNTLEILREYESRDTRVRVIAQPQNMGVSIARNTGINAATGEYIGFVDPDDYVDLDFYEKLYNKAQNTGAEITVGNICEYMFDGKKRKYHRLLKNIVRDKLNFNYTMWCAIYKRDFIVNNGIECPPGVHMTEDTVFVIKSAVLANKITVVPNTYYHYVRVQNSLASVYLSETKTNSIIQAGKILVDFLNTQNLTVGQYHKMFRKPFNMVAYSTYPRTTLKSERMKLAHATIELYNMHKYKYVFANHPLYLYLCCGNAEGIYDYMKEMFAIPNKTYVHLFKVIPIIRIRNYELSTKISILGIPVLNISRVKRGLYIG